MASADTPSKTPFEDFLLTEYSNLAQAFFSAATGITQFFQYYLLILSVPLTALGVVVRISTDTWDISKFLRSTLATPVGTFFVVIAFVGLCMAAYIINLRLDALLYAHAVNGIRRYFYERSGLRDDDRNGYRVLPVELDKPGWFEPYFFLPVVLAFAALNCLYVALGLYLFHIELKWMVVGAVTAFAAHVGLYSLLAYKRGTYLPV